MTTRTKSLQTEPQRLAGYMCAIVGKKFRNIGDRSIVNIFHFSVEYRPIYVCTSQIQPNVRENIRQQLQSIGGEVVGSCDKHTSYLATTSISLTFKVLIAMIHGIPIVTPAFISEVR